MSKVKNLFQATIKSVVKRMNWTVLAIGATLAAMGMFNWQTLPMQWGVALDLSGSFAEDLPRAKRVLVSGLCNAIRPGDRLIVCVFAKSPRLIVDTMANRQTLEETIQLLERMQPMTDEQGTDIVSAIALLTGRLQDQRKGWLLIATDGFQDPPISANLPDIKTNLRVLFIGWENDRDAVVTSALLKAKIPFLISNWDGPIPMQREKVWRPRWWLLALGLALVLWWMSFYRIGQLDDRQLMVAVDGFKYNFPWRVGQVVTIGSSLEDTVFVPSSVPFRLLCSISRFGFWVQKGRQKTKHPPWRKFVDHFDGHTIVIEVEFVKDERRKSLLLTKGGMRR